MLGSPPEYDLSLIISYLKTTSNQFKFFLLFVKKLRKTSEVNPLLVHAKHTGGLNQGRLCH